MANKEDVDKLIELALGEGEVKPITDGERFAIEFGIEASEDNWVHGQVVYFLYLHWYYDNNIGDNPMHRDIFARAVMRNYKKKMHGQLGAHYAIKHDDRYIQTKEEYRFMRGHIRDENQEEKRLRKWRVRWEAYLKRKAKLKK